MTDIFTWMAEALQKETWREKAACRHVNDPNLFHPDSKVSQERLDLALDYCRACPVRQECLDLCLAEDIRAGIWGGMTFKDRRLAGHHPGRPHNRVVNLSARRNGTAY